VKQKEKITQSYTEKAQRDTEKNKINNKTSNKIEIINKKNRVPL